MRLWDIRLLHVLPRQQLISQYRECCCIAKNISINGTPNHVLVNRMMDYSESNFLHYTENVMDEMKRRGYRISDNSLNKFYSNMNNIPIEIFGQYVSSAINIYDKWMNNDVYLRECLFNLEEKYICGGISSVEWNKIYNEYGKKFGLQR